ncbi:MAG: bacitracin ABC transporter ATP-binding protein [Candidatus Riflebacteria bacterium HGW-Riflebacteria-2]|jgi:ABC-2 type transport system ATP-binding protein|nr:MAG: bacitracin ABC transporter ATP-binding protein [Candidatus Riflebacteria bacterium HGW-Riflebacteria-2]
MSDFAVEVEGLEKSYGQTKVVKGISFTVRHGEIFGFLGPNGAGKTTSIRMMIGEIPFSNGRISIMGHPVPDQIHQTRIKVGVVPDYQNLYDRITVRQNLEFFSALNSVSASRIDEVLSEVFLVEHQHKACKDLSRGLRQRALIARGLLHKPRLFFLDEPTSALDPHSARLIRELVMQLKNNGTTVFLTTHYMEEANQLCDRLAILNAGEIVACDSPENLKKNFGRKAALVEYLEQETKHKADFSLENPQDIASLAELISTGKILRIHSQEATLEEVFMKVTGARWKSGSEEVEA